MTDQLGHWVSILDYAHLKGKSISTIRRSIKANHIKFKLEDGKYFIYCHHVTPSKNNQNEIVQLKQQIEKLVEENEELKMLVQLYEERLQLTFNFQELPALPNELNHL